MYRFAQQIDELNLPVFTEELAAPVLSMDDYAAWMDENEWAVAGERRPEAPEVSSAPVPFRLVD